MGRQSRCRSMSGMGRCPRPPEKGSPDCAFHIKLKAQKAVDAAAEIAKFRRVVK